MAELAVFERAPIGGKVMDEDYWRILGVEGLKEKSWGENVSPRSWIRDDGEKRKWENAPGRSQSLEYRNPPVLE